MNEPGLTSRIPLAKAAGARPGWRCPDEALVVAWVEGRLEGARRDAVESHLSDCAFCLGQAGFLSRAGELGPPPAVPTHLLALAQGERPGLIGHLRPASLVAATAGLVLALAVVSPRGRDGSLTGFLGFDRPETASPAAPTADRILRNGQNAAGDPRILRPFEGEIVPRAGFDLRWREVAGSLFYTVQLLDSKGDVVWERRTEATRLTLPAEAALAPGQTYFAWVLAHLPSGASVRSPAVGFRVAPG
jgi:hypothetical protein